MRVKRSTNKLLVLLLLFCKIQFCFMVGTTRRAFSWQMPRCGLGVFLFRPRWGISSFGRFAGLGTLHPDIQRFPIDADRVHRIYEACEGRLPILMHTGDHRFDFSNPSRMKPILDRYKDLTVIGAHFGGWSVWDEAERMLTGYENFYVDCSSSLYAMSPERAGALIRAFGTDRVLFGTDYPMWDIEADLARFMRIDLTDTARRAILSENAARLFGIK